MEKFRIDFPATSALDYPTIFSLASHIMVKHEGFKLDTEVHHPITIGGNHQTSATSAIAAIASLHAENGGKCSQNIPSFIDLALQGPSLQRVVPLARWDVDAYFSPSQKRGYYYTRFASFASNIDMFDNEIFGMSHKEATALDPQGRLLLEKVTEALDEAKLTMGIDPLIHSSSTATYVGCIFYDYSDFLRVNLFTKHSGAIMTGNGAPYQSGRVAYTFGFQGPCMGIDTACSSSLVAVHCAHRGIVTGEASVAVSSGVNALLWHETSAGMCQLHALSRVGRCQTFDASADGYGRAEGFVSAVSCSERLLDSSSLPMAIVGGSAANQDGRSSSLTSPNGPSQKVLITCALKSGGIDASQVDMIVVHGTGTPLGDPIEVGALADVLGVFHRQPFCMLSVKSCFGHTEGAAGLTGALLSVEAARRIAFTPIVNLRNLNTYLMPIFQMFHMGLAIPKEASPNPNAALSAETYAGTSSFGITGVNAHLLTSSRESLPERKSCATHQWRNRRFMPFPDFSRLAYKTYILSTHERVIFEGDIATPGASCLRDHSIAGRILLPATCMLVSSVSAASALASQRDPTQIIRNIIFSSPFELSAQNAKIWCEVEPSNGEIYLSNSSHERSTSRHASGNVSKALHVRGTGTTTKYNAWSDTCRKLTFVLWHATIMLKPNRINSLALLDEEISDFGQTFLNPIRMDSALHLSALASNERLCKDETIVPASLSGMILSETANVTWTTSEATMNATESATSIFLYPSICQCVELIGKKLLRNKTRTSKVGKLELMYYRQCWSASEAASCSNGFILPVHQTKQLRMQIGKLTLYVYSANVLAHVASLIQKLKVLGSIYRPFEWRLPYLTLVGEQPCMTPITD